MTGLELTLLLAFIGVVAIAVLAVIKWSHYGQWYHANDNWWEAQLSETEKSIKLWHNFYVTALSAAQDLDLQVSDGNSHQNVQFNENQCLLFERNSARKVADEAKAELDKTETQRLELEAELAFLKSNNHNIVKRCHSCGRGVAKSTPLVDGVYTCKRCLATQQGLADAPFEGLEGVRVGDSVLFSDCTIHNVRVLDEIGSWLGLNDGFFVVPPVGERHTAFWLGDGKHFCDQTDVRAIRIATALDIKLYGGGE